MVQLEALQVPGYLGYTVRPSCQENKKVSFLTHLVVGFSLNVLQKHIGFEIDIEERNFALVVFKIQDERLESVPVYL